MTPNMKSLNSRLIFHRQFVKSLISTQTSIRTYKKWKVILFIDHYFFVMTFFFFYNQYLTKNKIKIKMYKKDE